MSPKRTPVPSAGPSKPKRKKKKRPPPKREPQFDMAKIPEPATPERIAQVASKNILASARNTSEGIPPEKPTELDDSRESKASLFRWLRWTAGMYYTTDLRGCTIDQLSKHPMFKVVGLRTLATWSTEDRWVERRQINLEQWRRAIENKIGSELVRARKTGLGKLNKIFDKIFAKIEAEAVEGTTPQLVLAIVRLAELMDSWNDRIAKAVIPDLPSQATVAGPAETAKPQLTQEEARAAAKLIIQTRRDGMRAKAQRQQEEAEHLEENSGETLD